MILVTNGTNSHIHHRLDLYVSEYAVAAHNGHKHDLQLAPITIARSGKCLTMGVLHIHGQLQLWMRDFHRGTGGGFSNDDELVWHQARALGPVWNKVAVYFQPADNVTVQPLLHSEYDGSLISGTIPVAIDNIQVTDGPCHWNKGKSYFE